MILGSKKYLVQQTLELIKLWVKILLAPIKIRQKPMSSFYVKFQTSSTSPSDEGSSCCCLLFFLPAREEGSLGTCPGDVKSKAAGL